MKTPEEIEQLADKFATSIYGFRNENHNSYLECKRNCIEFYTQCQEDMADISKVTRFEVIDENGRAYTQKDCKVELSYQDDGRTLKVFINSLNKKD